MDVRISFISLRSPNTLLSRPFARGLQYAAKSGNRYTDPDTVRQVLEYPFTFLKTMLLLLVLFLLILLFWKISVIIHEVYPNYDFEQSAVEPLTQISGLSKRMVFLTARYLSA